MKKRAQRRKANLNYKRSRGSWQKKVEWKIEFAPPPLPGQLGFDFGIGPNEPPEVATGEGNLLVETK